ncbi:hypothetical protein ErraS_00007 [Pseudomonas phage vB_PpuP-ErraS]
MLADTLIVLWNLAWIVTVLYLGRENKAKLEPKTKLEPETKPFLGFMVVAYQDGGELSSVFSSKKEADALADKWAKESPGAAYYVVGVMDKVKADVVLTRE